MKLTNTLITILFISLLSSPSWSLTFSDLVERDGLHYEKFTDVPFNGRVTGDKQGLFKKGKKEGAWVVYHETGQLRSKGNYRNGKLDGAGVYYHKNGRLSSKGNWKNGELDGAWIHYHENETVDEEKTGTFKNGKKIND